MAVGVVVLVLCLAIAGGLELNRRRGGTKVAGARHDGESAGVADGGWAELAERRAAADVATAGLPGAPQAGWYADPEQPDRYRYWDGATWTDQVS